MNKWIVMGALLGSMAAVAAPPQGVPLEVERGFFTETNIGAFFTVGGDDAYSNAQTYLQLGMGYDFGERLELGLNFGLGTNAANCFSGRGAGGTCAQGDNFTLMFLNGSAAWNFRLAERLFLGPKLSAGWTTLDPAPVKVGDTAVRSGPNVGAGVGIEYVTAMKHFSIGAEVMGRYVLRANIPGIAVFPRVKYTF
jgi:hypothetical protein